MRHEPSRLGWNRYIKFIQIEYWKNVFVKQNLVCGLPKHFRGSLPAATLSLFAGKVSFRQMGIARPDNLDLLSVCADPLTAAPLQRFSTETTPTLRQH
jgi:hypothetical protein